MRRRCWQAGFLRQTDDEAFILRIVHRKHFRGDDRLRAFRA